MYFDISGIVVEPWIPPTVAFAISFFTSMAGVSGAFLLLPFQMSVLGYTSPSVSATNQLFNIIATPGGVLRYFKEGRLVVPLAMMIIAGTLPGVFIGAIIRMEYLPDPVSFKFFAGLVLLYIAFKILKEIFSNKINEKKMSEQKFNALVSSYTKNKEQGIDLPKVRMLSFSPTSMAFEFYSEQYSIPVIKLSVICFLVGIVSGIYGIGGGAIIAPFLLTFFGLPVYSIAGATLAATFATSVFGVIFYQILSLYYDSMIVAPDYLLGLLFGIGGLAGMYFGAKMQKYIPAGIIKWILAFCLVFISIKYIYQFID